MGQTTPNIGIYIPAAGETNYDQSFAAGMMNIDQHDHSGGPNKGVPIATSGIADGSITYAKLNANVADNATGIGTAGSLGANQLSLLGLLKNIYQIATVAGFISKDGSLAHARTLTGVANQTLITNGDGVAGNPTIGLAAIVKSLTQPAFYAFKTANTADVTGNGAIYTVLSDSIQKNQPGTPYSAGTGQFTVPAGGGGTYLLIGKVRISDFATATGAQVRIQTTAQLFVGDEFVPSGVGFNSLSVVCLAPMAAGDTCSLQIQVSGMAGNTADVSGDAANAVTFLAGYLLF